MSRLVSPVPTAARGLCAFCLHSKVIESAKGSSFILCALSNEHPNYPKYPRLPVLKCAGYEQNNEQPETQVNKHLEKP